MKTQRTFKPGDYCRFTPEEIPNVMAIVQANGHHIWSLSEYFPHQDSIICSEDGDIFSTSLDIATAMKNANELSRHDFFVTALRLNEGDGLRSDMSTPEQRKHITETLEKLGVCQHFLASTRTDKSYWSSFNFCGNIWVGCNEKSVTNHIPYSEWCKRLNVEPIGKTAVKMAMDAVSSGVVAPKCSRDGSINHLPDVGEKVFPSDLDVVRSCPLEDNALINAYQMGAYWMREQCKNIITEPQMTPNNTLTLPDGTTVDLTKPLEVSYGGDKWEDDELEFHFVGFNSAGHIIVECLSDCELHVVDKIRNKPEPEFKPGDKVWYSYKNDSGLSYYHIGTYSDHGDIIDQDGEHVLSKAEIRPAFDDGKPVYPPFND